MDCLDCHNRPSHNYEAPQNFIDKSIAEGKISKKLPGIKMLAMQILNQNYSTRDSAFLSIESQVNNYYTSTYPEIMQGRKSEVDAAITEIQNGYASNIFPFMKASWKSYPNNLGHMESDGCYRCHNDRHTSESGKVISNDCSLCHEILAQGQNGNMEYSTSFKSLDFKHPVDIGDDWKTNPCSMCHSALY
jgi:hypothetical protein